MTRIEYLYNVFSLNRISVCGIGFLGGATLAPLLYPTRIYAVPLESALILLRPIIDLQRRTTGMPISNLLSLAEWAIIAFSLGYLGRWTYDVTVDIFQSVRKTWFTPTLKIK